MNSQPRSCRLLWALAGVSMLFVCGSLIPSPIDTHPDSARTLADLKYIDPGWNLRVIKKMPERITTLLASLEPHRLGEYIYIGTGGLGSIHRLYHSVNGYPQGMRTIALALGDTQEFCTCEVNRLAIRDLDHDGIEEIIAETSQIMPRGRPRIYVWSDQGYPLLRGFARPAIESSWGHGMGFIPNPDCQSDSIISTYCGYGEIVEYQLSTEQKLGGFQEDGLGWRIVGRLPASGEGVDVADIDDDGQSDICIGTGFSANKAAIHIYSALDRESANTPKIIIDEGRRFGTVRFILGSTVPGSTRDVFAWWCTGLGQGHTELFRYRLGNEGVIYSELIAASDSDEIWPIDGQMCIADLNGNGHNEVWFATSAGHLYRYAPEEGGSLSLMCHLASGIGPIASGGVVDQACLYLGYGRDLLVFERSATPD